MPHANGDLSKRLVTGGAVAKRFNRAVHWLVARGVNLMGARVLRVRGRKSGEWRETPVNLMVLDGTEYLVAPRGHTQWVRNLRVSGEGELRIGKRVETFTATELPDSTPADATPADATLADTSKAAVIREYIRKWGWEVGAFLPGIDKNSSDDEIRAIEPGFPVFRIKTGSR